MRNPVLEGYERRVAHQFDADYFNAKMQWARKHDLVGKLVDECKVVGLENLGGISDRQVLWVSNHQSMLDFLITPYVLWEHGINHPMIVAGENLAKGPLGAMFRKCGAIFVDRNDTQNKEYLRVYNAYILQQLADEKNLLVYPEGGRNGSRSEIGQFKNGPFGQVIRSGRNACIVPIHISYDKVQDDLLLEQAWWLKKQRDKMLKGGRKVSSKLFDYAYFGLDFMSFLYRVTLDRKKGNCYLSFGQPLSVNNFVSNGGNRRTLASTTRDQIVGLAAVVKSKADRQL